MAAPLLPATNSVMVIGVRADTPSGLAATDGDQETFHFDGNGRLHVTGGTSATDIGKAEDAAHTSGDTGMAVLGVRRDTPAVGSTTDGDYSTINVDASGRVWVNVNAISAIAFGAGGVGATVPRVTLASDDPAVVALQIMDDWDSSDAAKTVGIATFVQGTCDGANALAAAGDYAANDVLSNDAGAGAGDPWLFTGLARVSGGSGIISRAVITTNVEAFAARLRLWLFNAAPSAATEQDDNAAFLLDADDKTKLIGYIDFDASADAGEVSVTQNLDVRMAFKAVGSANIYGILQTLDAITNETAGMLVTIELHALQD